MKVFFSSYRHYVHPGYEMIDNLYDQNKINEEWKEKIETFLTKFYDFFNKIWKKLQIEYVHIDKWDVHSMDVTLSKIIYPMLLELKRQNKNFPILLHDVNDCFPEEYHISEDFDVEFDDNEICKQRWHFLLDEMIYAFGAISSEKAYDIDTPYSIDSDRVEKGLQYFGRFYNHLWM